MKAALEGDGDVVVTIDSGKLSDERELGSARRPTTDDVTRRLLPEFPVATPGQAVQAQRNAEARLELLDEFGAFTSDQISERRSNAKNVHALANRWKNEGRVFAVRSTVGNGCIRVFNSTSRRSLRKQSSPDVLKALPRAEMGAWEVALWWTAGNGWLGGERPVDVIDGNREPLIGAASRLAQPSAL